MLLPTMSWRAGAIALALATGAWITPATAQFDELPFVFHTTTGGGQGTVTAAEMVVFGPNNGCVGGGTASFMALAPIDGTVVVQGKYDDFDDKPGQDPPVSIVNGVVTEIEANAVGEIVLHLHAGDSFGFGVHATDCCCGPGVLTLDEFQFFPAAANLHVTGSQQGEGFGGAVAAAGDVDGDGTPDAVVGEAFAKVGGVSKGRAVVVSGASGAPLLSVVGDGALDEFGATVAGGADLDGNGVPDVVVGAPKADTAVPLATDAGLARAFSAVTGAPLFTLRGQKAFDECGAGLAVIGDQDGDGLPDVAVGSPFNDTAASNAGEVRIVSGVTGSVLVTLLGDVAGDRFGSTIAATGDVNGDGVPDILVGAPGADGALADVGRVDAVSGLDGAKLRTVFGTWPGGLFGSSLADAGDSDGDGIDDFVVGAPLDSVYGLQVGSVALFSGATGAVLQTFHGSSGGDQLGQSVAGAGDVDQDGLADVMMGAPQLALPAAPGEVRVHSGHTGILLQAMSGTGLGDRFGQAVADLGSGADNDRLLAVGAPAHDQPVADAGEVQLVSFKTIWANIGHGTAGTTGVPALGGAGLLIGHLPVTLELSNAAPQAPAVLIVGLSQLVAPFKDGVLVPAPDLLVSGLVTSGAGNVKLVASLPFGIDEGVDLYFQMWIPDAAGPAGFAASNALHGQVP